MDALTEEQAIMPDAMADAINTRHGVKNLTHKENRNLKNRRAGIR